MTPFSLFRAIAKIQFLNLEKKICFFSYNSRTFKVSGLEPRCIPYNVTMRIFIILWFIAVNCTI